MADDATRLQTITNNIQQLYEASRRAASNIAGLLQIGEATCEEVRAYNLWAMSTYNTQRGMLATLRAAGQTDVPELPPSPTWFSWRGISGEEAWRFDCGDGAVSGLGALKAAMKPPTKRARRLSTNDVQIVTSDPYLFDPQRAPTFKDLIKAQQAQTAGLGLPVVWIVIAVITVGISLAATVKALMHWLEVSDIQESNSKQVALQADAFANYTAARLECLKTCTGQGKSTEDCVGICNKIVDKPNIKLPGQLGKWGWLQWTGFTVVAGVGTMLVYSIWKRRVEGRPVFDISQY